MPLQAAHPVGDDRNSIKTFSVTLTRSNGDIDAQTFTDYCEFIKEVCICGIVSIERGGRQGQLHLQSWVRVRCSSSVTGIKRLRDKIRELCALVVGHKISAKLFAPGQTVERMSGYGEMRAPAIPLACYLLQALPSSSCLPCPQCRRMQVFLITGHMLGI